MAMKGPSKNRKKTVRSAPRKRPGDRPRRRPTLEDFEEKDYGDHEWQYSESEHTYDEDMLSEFSDETNDFYTDELSQRRERERKAQKGKVPEKKAEKRKPISPLRRKIIRILSYCAIVAVILIVGVVLSLTVLFKTQAYEIEGNTKYAEDEIIETCDIGKGENIFLAPKGAAEKRIKNQFPYVENVEVSFKIPDTIKISIEEAIEGYLVKKNNTEYLVISTKGRILNQTTDPSAYKLPIFIGPTLTSGEIGEYVAYKDQTVVDMIQSVTQTFADNGYEGITEIDATNMANITFTYDDRIKVKLGLPEELDYKIRTAMTIIIENLDKNQTNTTKGILDVSRCHKTKRSYFNEQDIHPTQAASTTPTEAGDDEEWTDDDYTYEEYSDEDDDGDYSDYSDDDYSDYSDDEDYGEDYYE